MILGQIVERTSAPPQPPKAPTPRAGPSTAGFPSVQHRSARPPRAPATSSVAAPRRTILPSGTAPDDHASSQPLGDTSEVDQIRRDVDRQNSARVAAMSAAEREEELAELRERFGDGVMAALKRRAVARQQPLKDTAQPEAGPSSPRRPQRNPSDVEASQVRAQVDEENRQRVERMSPAERAEELRELEERFGSSVLDALRHRAAARSQRPPESVPHEGSSERISAAENASTASQAHRPADDPPDAAKLKAMYFADVPSEPDKLAWMSPVPSSSAFATSSVRFDLSGRPLTVAQSASISTTRGLHHHGDQPDLAGYTMDEILWLCRSTVPGQRVTMLGVLTRILEQYVNDRLPDEAAASVLEAKGLDSGVQLAIMGLQGRGTSLLRAGVDLLFVCLESEKQERRTDRAADLALVPFESLIPTLMDLVSSDLLPRASAEKTITILRTFISRNAEQADLVLPTLPQVLRAQVFDRPWPYEPSDPPSIQAIRLLCELIDGSRTSAELVVSNGMHSSLLKYIIPSLWTSVPDCAELASLALRVFGGLGKYGLASSTAVTARDVFADLGAQLASSREASSLLSKLQGAFWDLLAVWTTCAIDPHRTTPEHDLTWAQLESLAWVEQALSVRKSDSDHGDDASGALLWLLVAWCEGLRINSSNHGEADIARLAKSVQLPDLVDRQLVNDSLQPSRVVAAIVRLDRLFQLASVAPAQLVQVDTLSRLQPHGPGSTWGRSIEFDLLAHGVKAVEPEEWAKRVFALLASFRPGDEPLALDLVDSLLASSRPSEGDVDLVPLRPLLQYIILPDVKSVVAPSIPHHLYLKSTSALRLPEPHASATEVIKTQGLPLRRDWVFSTLDELLRSADSDALQVAQSLPGWNFTETEVVRSTLHLALKQCRAFPPEPICHEPEAGSVTGDRQGGMTRTDVVLGLMKVFMLEHNQGTTSGQEIFRDAVVEQALSDLLASTIRPVEYQPHSLAPASGVSLAPLEEASSASLGLGSAPFFQFYSDLVGLSNTTFPHPVLSALLVVPLSSAYAKDYRLAVWGDESALRQIKIPASGVPLELPNGLDAFFSPPERDLEVLGAYCRALGKGWVRKESGFTWDQAVFHISRFLWSDMAADGSSGERRTMLRALMLRAPEDVVRALVCRSEDWSAAVSVESDEVQRRIKLIGDLVGPEGLARVESICRS